MKVNTRQLKKWIAALDSKKPDRRSRIGFLEFSWPLSYETTFVINRDFERKTSISMSYLYDGKGWKLTEIATLLELVYIHKVLD